MGQGDTSLWHGHEVPPTDGPLLLPEELVSLMDSLLRPAGILKHTLGASDAEKYMPPGNLYARTAHVRELVDRIHQLPLAIPTPESLRANGKQPSSCRLYKAQRKSNVISQTDASRFHFVQRWRFKMNKSSFIT